MIGRRLPPVHSPISFRTLGTGLVGALGRAGEPALRQALRSDYTHAAARLTDSGTSALALALTAAGATKGGLAALPAFACYDLATAADCVDARVVLYDVDPETLAPDAASFARALACGPRATVVVHPFGLPIDAAQLRATADSHGSTLIEDAAQAFGATFDDRLAGTTGNFGILSFGRGKGISGGGGGAVLANDADAVELIDRHAAPTPARAGWTNLAKSAAQWALGRPAAYGVVAALPFLRLGETIYHPAHAPGAMSRASARMVAQLWGSARAALGTRRLNGLRLRAASRTHPIWRPIHIPAGAEPTFLRFPLISLADRDVTASAAARRLGVMRGYPRALHELPGFAARCINAMDGFPGAHLLSRRLITLPTHSLVSAEDVRRLERWLADPGASASPDLLVAETRVCQV